MMKLDLQNSLGHKKRILVGLSWDDITLSNPAKIYAVKPTFLPEPVSGFLGHVTAWFQEIFWATGRTVKVEYRQAKASKRDDTAGRDTDYGRRDLDLLCFIYDKDGNFIREIGPDPENMIDEATSIYHSGEEFTGEGVYDDESIRIDIEKLPAGYRDFIFVVLSDSKLSLAQCGKFKIHLSDSTKDTHFVVNDVEAPQGSQSSAYVFAHIRRDGDEWTAKSIAEYGDFDTDWATELKKHL